MQDPSDIPAIDLPEQLRLLEEHGRQLAQNGAHEDAERIFREIIRAAPQHVPALRYLAGRALVGGDPEEAQRLTERAIRIYPQSAMLHQHLAIILRARGYLDGSVMALETALKLRPDIPMYWLQRGDVLNALGRHDEGIASYKRAADLAGDLGALFRANRGGPQVQQAIRRASRLLVQARESAVAEAVASLRKRHGGETLARAEAAVKHMTRAAPPDYADPLQRPAFGYFPGATAQPFFPRRDFPGLEALEQATDTIRGELAALLEDREGMKPYVEVPEGREGVWNELNRSQKWSAYHLFQNGERIAAHTERCPATADVVRTLPLVRIPGQAPEVFFSLLEPGTHIPPHHGLANYKLAVHLPLIIPKSCAIRVGDQTRIWQPGECLVFDDSFEHEAWNRSDELRAVLILEVWHPELTDPEKEFITAAVAALDRFNRKHVRLADRALRARSA